MINQIWTIGHSTRKIDDFISALGGNGIKLVADVRLLPGSKRHPQFNRDALASSLKERGIRYEHFQELGGRRKAKPDSRNSAWRNEAFRGYADHMETEEFQKGMDRFVDLATGRVRPTGGLAGQTGPTAIMCAELLWWRCHRALISDFLKVRGVDVTHIVDLNKSEPHPYTSAAKIIDGSLSYAADGLLL